MTVINDDKRKAHNRLQNQRRRQERTIWFEKYKQSLKCEVCGELDIVCLQFHHKNPKEKKGAVTHLVHYGMSIKAILLEIAKCRVLCANCHLKEHARLRRGM